MDFKFNKVRSSVLLYWIWLEHLTNFENTFIWYWIQIRGTFEVSLAHKNFDLLLQDGKEIQRKKKNLLVQHHQYLTEKLNKGTINACYCSVRSQRTGGFPSHIPISSPYRPHNQPSSHQIKTHFHSTIT